jgi:bacillithiol system protein YtxJ
LSCGRGGRDLRLEAMTLSLKDRTEFLSTPEQVDRFLGEHKAAAIFKAGACHKTPASFVHVQAKLEPREDLPFGIIRVVEARAASNHLAELTGVTHESPQLFLFKDGKAVFDLDNWDITPEDIEAAFVEHFPKAPTRP